MVRTEHPAVYLSSLCCSPCPSHSTIPADRLNKVTSSLMRPDQTRFISKPQFFPLNIPHTLHLAQAVFQSDFLLFVIFALFLRLFDGTIRPPTTSVRSKADLKDVSRGDQTKMWSLYADDLIMFVSSSLIADSKPALWELEKCLE